MKTPADSHKLYATSKNSSSSESRESNHLQQRDDAEFGNNGLEGNTDIVMVSSSGNLGAAAAGKRRDEGHRNRTWRCTPYGRGHFVE